VTRSQLYWQEILSIMEHGKTLKMPSRPSSSPWKCKMKRSRAYITHHRGTRNLANGTKNGADMLGEPIWTKLLKCMHSAELWILLFTTNYSNYLQCQLHWLDLSRKPENSIRIGAPLPALLEDSNNRIHAFGKSQKKNLRSMPFHNPLLLDRTEDEDMDVDAEKATVVEDSPWKNTRAASTTTFVFTVVYLDILPSIVPPCQILDQVPAFDHKAADLLSNKLIPFQKKGWRSCHSKMKANLILPPSTNLNHWSNSI